MICFVGLLLPDSALAVDLFGPASVKVPVVDNPGRVVAGDFNGDAVVDLAVVNQDSELFPPGLLSIRLGDGQGGFFSAGDIDLMGPGPRDIAVGDFNGDGVADLVVTLAVATGGLRILFGDGRGGFLHGGAVGSAQGALAVGDFNGDGNADLAAGSTTVVNIYLGDGLGGFSATSEISVANYPTQIAVGEFNGDHASDLAVVSYDGDSVSILLGDGLGGFSSNAEIGVGDRPMSVAVSDFNSDGAADLAVANSFYLTGSVSILLGNGQGGFALAVDLDTSGHGAYSVACADFNGDGVTDLAVNAASEAQLYLGDGAGKFVRTTRIEISVKGYSIVGEDFNGDSAVDLALVSAFGDTVTVLSGDGLGGFVTAPQVDVGGQSVLTGEFNGDGIVDLAVTDNFQPENVKILLGDGLGGFTFRERIELEGLIDDVAVADFNDDTVADLAVVVRQEGPVIIVLGDGSGGFSSNPGIDVGGYPHSVTVGEFNGDGAVDLVLSLESSLTVLLGDGLGGFSVTPEIGLRDYPRDTVVGEFNGDGAADLVVTLSSDSLAVLLGDGVGGFSSTPEIGVGDSPSGIAVGEFNGDGAADLVVASLEDQIVSILEGDGFGNFFLAAAIGVELPLNSFAVGEFNGDGAPDLIVSGDNGMSILFNQLFARADVNGSNRIDGFDTGEIGRLIGAVHTESRYRRNVDIDLNGVIDGDDLARAGLRFGELRKEASPLRATLQNPLPPAPNSVTLRQVGSQDEVFRVEVLVNSDEPAAAAEFAMVFHPSDDDSVEVLEMVGFEPGSFLSGAAGQLYNLDTSTPGRIEAAISRLPSVDRVNSGLQPLVNLFFRARREGRALLDFDASPRLLSVEGCPIPEGCEVVEVTFAGGVTADVTASAEGSVGQRIGVRPSVLDFGRVAAGSASRKRLRVSNFGYSELELRRITAAPAEFTTFAGSTCDVEQPDATCLTIPPFGFVELIVEFSPTIEGTFTGDLVIESNDTRQPQIQIRLLGRSGT